MGPTLSKSSPELGLFTCFNQLPVELRLEIWEQSLPPRNMMLNLQPRPVGVRRVITSDDWHRGLPAHLFTCWEARHVALARRPWKYNQIDILYLAGRMNAYFKADITWGPYAGRERILAIDDGCPFWYKTKKYERFRPREGHPRVTRSIGKLGNLFGGLDRIEMRKGGCGQVLLVVGTLKCKEPEWLFANSDLVILALHDPRLEQALDSYPRVQHVDRTKKLVRRGIGSCYFLTGDEGLMDYLNHVIASLAGGLRQRLIPGWLLHRYQEGLGDVAGRNVNEFSVRLVCAKVPKLQLAIAFEKVGGRQYWQHK